MSRLDELLARPISMRSIGLLRALVGAIALVHLWPIATDAWRGDTFRDRFHHPYVDALAAPPEWVHAGALTVGLVAAALTTVGMRSRVATWTTFAVVVHHLLVSTTHLHNNRAYLATVLGLVAMAPNDRAFSIDELRRRRRGAGRADDPAPAWPLWLLRFECATVYAASGVSKLVDPDWFGGDVTWGRVTAGVDRLTSSPLPQFVVDLLLDRSFHSLAAKAVVLTELAIAAGLWWRPARRWIVALAVAFHVLIELSSDVQLFSYLAVAVLVVWAEPALPGPERRAREVAAADGARPVVANP